MTGFSNGPTKYGTPEIVLPPSPMKNVAGHVRRDSKLSGRRV
jgi:hypothetical protein